MPWDYPALTLRALVRIRAPSGPQSAVPPTLSDRDPLAQDALRGLQVSVGNVPSGLDREDRLAL